MKVKKVNLAKLIHDAYVDRVELGFALNGNDLRSLKTLRKAVNRNDGIDIGDSLFRWIVNEAVEGGETVDGKFDVDAIVHVLERGVKDMEAVIESLNAV